MTWILRILLQEIVEVLIGRAVVALMRRVATPVAARLSPVG